MSLRRVLWGLCVVGSSSAFALEMSPKMHLKTGTGLLVNSVGGNSSPLIGGFIVSGQLSLTPWLAAGVGYRADFDVANRMTPLKGFDVFGKLSFWGLNSRRLESSERVLRDYRDRIHAYAIGSFENRSFQLRSDLTGGFLEGVSNGVAFGVGLEYALSDHFELTAEVLQTVLSFSDQPDRIRLMTSSLLLGLGYVF